MKIVSINSWYDPPKEGDAAKALIDQGADIIAQHTDSASPLQVCEQRGIVGFGQASDMSPLARRRSSPLRSTSGIRTTFSGRRT